MDIKYLCYLILVRKDLSTSLCVWYSKSGSGTLFVDSLRHHNRVIIIISIVEGRDEGEGLVGREVCI